MVKTVGSVFWDCTSACKKNPQPNFAPYLKINLKWSIYVHVEIQTIKLQEEITEENLCDLESKISYIGNKNHKLQEKKLIK